MSEEKRKEVEVFDNCIVERIYNDDGTFEVIVRIKSGVEPDKIEAKL